ncbi:MULTISPECIES: cyanamide hydratase [Nonomuraea]|uniref:Cyanamide hydratase n=1 Tax=Nonomuraea salmonea TaxID=46181 RepID=A0ABV5NZJ2_9ACTN
MTSETPATTAALTVARRFYPPALLDHCVRTRLWGTTYAAAHGIAIDDELFSVAALLHDMGLTKAFDSHTVPFEEAGGCLGWVFCTAAGWPDERAARAEEIIVLHMRADVPAADDPEAHVLQVASSFEVVGRWHEQFPDHVRADVLTRHPRRDFPAGLLAAFEDQARRKPGSAAARSVRNALAERMAANPLDS